MTFVIDASVATKLFIEEPDSKAARACFASSQVIAAPKIFQLELTSACIVQWRLRGQSKTEISRHVALCIAFCDAANMTLFPNEEDLNEAIALAIFHEHRIADCLYISLAKRLALPLLTADKKQLAIARLEGIGIEPFDAKDVT